MKPAKRNSTVVIVLLLTLLSFSCGKENVSEEVLVKVYVENVIAEQSFSNNTDSLRHHKNAVFKKYGLTEKEFETGLRKFSQDKDSWSKFFTKANNYLNELKKSNTIN